MEGMRFFQTIRLDNILSFGPSEEEFPLEPLNVLIGPNASGKSNLIEVLSLLHAALLGIFKCRYAREEVCGNGYGRGTPEPSDGVRRCTLPHPF